MTDILTTRNYASTMPLHYTWVTWPLSGTTSEYSNHNVSREPQQWLDDYKKGYIGCIVDCNKMSKTCKISNDHLQYYSASLDSLLKTWVTWSAIEFIDVELNNRDWWWLSNHRTALICQCWSWYCIQDIPCHCIQVRHHWLEGTMTRDTKVLQGTNMSIVDIKVHVCREVDGLVNAWAPLTDGRI